jgi:pyruvate dehydrogenase E2 component (dihydrolipoamide acetyltransferase)
VNVGLAVAAQDALVFPTIHDADTAPLGEIARLTDDLTQRAQAGALSPAETRGGTFTIFRAGAHGATRLTPILNAPQAANLAVGAVRVLPRVVDGQIVARHVVELTLVSDHRILYGPDAEQFLARIRAHLEAPEALTR